MIQVKEVSKTYGKLPVLDKISFELPASGITTILGPNGAGKSTLLGIISRLQSADSGQVLVDGLDVQKTPGRHLARVLAILRQENQMTTRLTVEDLVTFGRYPHNPGRLLPEDLRQVEQALSFLGLENLRHRYLDELSGGQRQRAFIAMVLCQDTRYLLLDEPLNSLDMQHAVSIMKLLRQAADEMGKKVLLVLHDINFAGYYSDWILAMKDGQLAYQGRPEHIITREIMKALYQLDMEIHQVRGKPWAWHYG